MICVFRKRIPNRDAAYVMYLRNANELLLFAARVFDKNRESLCLCHLTTAYIGEKE